MRIRSLRPPFVPLNPVYFIVLIGVTGALAGVWLESVPRASRVIVLLSGIVLVGMSFFWVVPEIAQHFGWAGGLSWVLAGFLIMWTVNRFVHPVCPSCSHDHDHAGCAAPLHGFAIPLIAASSFHSFMDGWSLTASHQPGFEDLQAVFLTGIALHKLPEGLALGGILRAAMASPRKALLAAAFAQSMAFAGSGLAIHLAPYVGPHWLGGMLGIAGGTFLYLGYHALESSLRGPQLFYAAVSIFSGSQRQTRRSK